MVVDDAIVCDHCGRPADEALNQGNTGYGTDTLYHDLCKSCQADLGFEPCLDCERWMPSREVNGEGVCRRCVEGHISALLFENTSLKDEDTIYALARWFRVVIERAEVHEQWMQNATETPSVSTTGTGRSTLSLIP